MTIVDSYISNVETFHFGKNMKIGCYNRIGENVTVGDDVTIGHHCIIEDDIVIGHDVVIDNYVLLKKNTKIGSNTFIDSYVRSSGDNRIGNNVTIRYGATIARGVIIENRSFISPNVMTIYSTHEGEKISGTVIGAKAFIGTGAVIGPGVKIGKGVTIGALAYVSKDCLEKGIYVGVPARKLEDK